MGSVRVALVCPGDRTEFFVRAERVRCPALHACRRPSGRSAWRERWRCGRGWPLPSSCRGLPRLHAIQRLFTALRARNVPLGVRAPRA
jgi:hypothetical protein